MPGTIITRALDKKRCPAPTAIFCLVTEVGGNYTPWEQSEAYGNDFSSENDALTPENTIPSEKKPESTGT